MRPQHLKDLVGPDGGYGAEVLVQALIAFVALVINGYSLISVLSFIFGVNLTTLKKQNGGIRPIAVGCTL